MKIIREETLALFRGPGAGAVAEGNRILKRSKQCP